MKALLIACVLVALILGALGDIYLHNPRGSNNRNRGNGVNVENPNRLFDSQNNNKGGYCWGPPMTYYEASMLQVRSTLPQPSLLPVAHLGILMLRSLCALGA